MVRRVSHPSEAPNSQPLLGVARPDGVKTAAEGSADVGVMGEFSARAPPMAWRTSSTLERGRWHEGQLDGGIELC